jgi:hypothetical protein
LPRSPGALCQKAPDGKHFFVVTTKGILATNQLRSEIWLFDTAAVRAYLHHGDGHAPAPRRLTQWTIVPKAVQYNSYGAVLTKAQWSSDSSSILFLAEEPNGKERIYRVGIRDGVRRAITANNENIEDFSEAAGTIVYSAKKYVRTWKAAMPGRPINEAASDLTGLSLGNILFPDRLRKVGSPDLPRDLWVRRANQATRINDSDGINEWHFPESLAIQFRPSISPDGTSFIAAKPVASVPAIWQNYKFASDTYRFTKLSITSDASGLVWSWPWRSKSM